MSEPIETNSNANATDESVPVPLSEAAERLGITLPRLTRLLKRPEFAGGVTKTERPTRTGTRTVTLVSVSVLEAIRLSLSEHKQEQYGPKRYLSEGAVADGHLPPLALQILAEREARLADKDAEIQRLTVTLTETQSALRLAQENLQREQTLRAIPQPQLPMPTVLSEAPETVPGDTEHGETPSRATPAPMRSVQVGAEGHEADRGNKPPEKPVGWGARLKGWFFNA